MKVIVLLLTLIASNTLWAQVVHNFDMGPDKTDCHTIPDKLKDSTKDPYTIISSATYRFKQEVTLSRYRSPKSGKYYSCDGEVGYMILYLEDDETAIFKNVPKTDWGKLSSTSDPFSLYKSGYYDEYRLEN